MNDDDMRKQENAGPGNFESLPRDAHFTVNNIYADDVKQVKNITVTVR